MRNVMLLLPIVYTAALFADDVPVAVSEAVSSSLDTIVYEAHSVKTLDAPVSLYGFTGATITARNLDSGVTETVVSDAAKAGAQDWMPSSGGVWELVNAQDGIARFTVRYSLFGNAGQGDGSVADPLKIVDCTEVKDIATSDADGFAFVLSGGGTWSSEMELPEGFFVSDIGDGSYMLDISSGGKVYSSSTKSSRLYTDGVAPNRPMRIREVRHISYSGDNWLGDLHSESVLAMVSPAGASDVRQHTGTGLELFVPAEKGRWNISLKTENLDFSALIDVLGFGTVVSIR